jgi:putative oxidoreductase
MIALIARILLGLIFVAAGASGFFLINNPPPMPPGFELGQSAMTVLYQSRWILFVGVIECISGVLLLANRYVPLALTMMAAIIFNMYVFHITMMLIGIFGPLILTLLWLAVATQHRAAFAPLFDAKA